MNIVQKYNYPKLTRIENNGVRYYTDGINTPVPSVTTILAATKDMTYINEWIAAVGEEKAEKIKNEASTLGTGIHNNIENYIANKALVGTYMDKALANVIIKKGMLKVNEIWGTEASLFAKDLYAGTTDLVGLYENKPAIMDFKNSLREKTKEMIEDYFLQCCAYKIAHDEMFGTDIQRFVIMMVTRNAKYIEFIIEGNEIQDYMYKWLKRLEQFYINFGK